MHHNGVHCKRVGTQTAIRDLRLIRTETRHKGDCRKMRGNSGRHSGFCVGCQAGIPVFECATQGVIESSRPGLKHEASSLF